MKILAHPCMEASENCLFRDNKKFHLARFCFLIFRDLISSQHSFKKMRRKYIL